jgi:predicted metal-dependent phosphoesterase TrpH
VKLADLHLHTHFSDGTYSPEELAAHARAQGLDAVALTDHDSVEGCERMETACTKEGLEFIPGAELTAEVTGQEVHILGYWMDLSSERLRVELQHFHLELRLFLRLVEPAVLAEQMRLVQMDLRLQVIILLLQMVEAVALQIGFLNHYYGSD